MVIRHDEEMIVNGRLTQTGVSFREIKKGYKRRVAVFKCECGSSCVKDTDSVSRGRTQSCGCLDLEKKHERGQSAWKWMTKHGMSQSKVFGVWQSMIQRCTNKKVKAYFRYGGRGIVVCDRWANFENFLNDMGNPETGQSLERIDNDMGYAPENCRWATKTEQANNKRNNVYLTIDNETQSVSQWCKSKNLPKSTVYNRLIRGWSHKEAVFGKTK